MVEKFLNILKLARFDNLIGVFLLFYPAALGLVINAKETHELKWLFLFFLGSILMRSVGCIVNDISDKDFDKQVKRTKNRPLASGLVSIKEALAFAFILCLPAFMIFLSLNKGAQILCIFSVISLIIYPFAKRFTYYPQIFLGLCFALSASVGYMQLNNGQGNIIYLFLAIIFWVVGYDTIYAFLDLKDDKKAGVKSLARKLENFHPKFWIFLFYTLFIINLILSAGKLHFITYILFILAYLILIWQALTLDIYNYSNCYKRFMSNQYVGGIIFISLLINFFIY